MTLNITEEQSINTAFNLITQGISAGTRFSSWFDRQKNEKSLQRSAPANTPIKRELKTSLVISASPIAITGGSRAHREPITLPSPAQVSQSATLPSQSGQLIPYCLLRR